MLYRNYLKSKYQNTAIKLANAEGVPCVLEYSKGKNVRNYEVYGNSVQDGTPTPESPVEIQSVGDLTIKNLLPYPYVNTTKTVNGVTFTDNGDGTITVSGTPTASISYYLGQVDVKPGEKYCLAGMDVGKNLAFILIGYSADGTKLSQQNSRSISYTAEDNATYVKIWIDRINTNVEIPTNIVKPQLELGSTATEYEPYHKYDIPIMVTGKNLFNKEDSKCYEIKLEPPTVININTYAVGILWSDQLISLFKPNITYTISCEIECVDVPSDDYTFHNGILGFLIQSKVSGYSSINMLVTHQLVKGEIYHFSKTFTIPSNFLEGTYTMYLYRNSYKNSDGKIITASVICRNIQIEEGSSSTAYEPYKGSITEHIYLDEPLRKVGDYADYIYFKNQKVVRKIEVLDDTGTKTISESFGTLSIPTEENISLPALKTFKGTTVMSVDTSIQASNIKANYIRT